MLSPGGEGEAVGPQRRNECDQGLEHPVRTAGPARQPVANGLLPSDIHKARDWSEPSLCKATTQKQEDPREKH